ncbi:MAG: RHS repeat-associated core domain-containing protein [Thermogutta sp.]
MVARTDNPDLGEATGAMTVVNHLIYDAFGKVASESNSAIDSLFLFTARPFDSDTQLQNNLDRWYDARVGRWLSEDPIGFASGDGNLYRYVGNGGLFLLVSRASP